VQSQFSLLVQHSLIFSFFLRLYYFSPQDPASFSAQDALGINLGYIVKETVSRTPASFAAVIRNCVVNEADKCLHPFLSIAHSQIHPPLPVSLTHIHCLQVATPLTRNFTCSLQFLISKNGICLQVGAIAQRRTKAPKTGLPPRVAWAAPGKT